TPNLLNTYFATRLVDGRTAVSQAFDPYFAITATPGSPAQTLATSDIARLSEQHRAWVAKFDTPTDPTFAEPAALRDFAGSWFDRQREQLLARGDVRRDADGKVRARLGFALRMLVGFLRRPKTPKNGTPVPPARLAALAAVVERVRQTVPPARVQWAL